MKAQLIFNLPEEQDDHKYALSGLDALIVISDLENEIRSKLRYDSGEFKEFYVEEYKDDGKIEKRKTAGCDDTLERVWEVLRRFKQERNLPELV